MRVAAPIALAASACVPVISPVPADWPQGEQDAEMAALTHLVSPPSISASDDPYAEILQQARAAADFCGLEIFEDPARVGELIQFSPSAQSRFRSQTFAFRCPSDTEVSQ